MTSKSHPLISVVIPCFNLGEYLEDAVASVVAQTTTDWELIIVDDGSTDKKTQRIIEKLKKENPDYIVLRQKNAGPSAARNHGISRSRGIYIVCLDADDMLAPTYLEKTTQLLDQDKAEKVAIVTTWLREFGDRADLWRASDFNVAKLLVTNRLHAASTFRKKVWEDTGGYKTGSELQGYEDWDFWLSIIEKGYTWQCIHEPLFLYRIRKNSLLSTAKDSHLYKYRLIFDLHHNLYKTYSKELAIENAEELKSLHDSIKEKDKAIGELEEFRNEVIELRGQVFNLRDEINSMRSSRVLGKIIKIREFVGTARSKLIHLPHQALHQIRVAIAPFIPRPARKALKRIYLGMRGLSTQQARLVTVTNHAIGKELPLISIVIPYYNRADTIDDTLVSLSVQSFKNFEVIIVDDGSSDHDSVTKLEEIIRSSFKVRIIHQANAGVAAARNNGITQARGKYILCLDSDDSIKPTFVEKALVVLETSPDFSLVTTHMETFGVINDPYKHIPYDPLKLIRNNMVITAAVFKKQAWEYCGGYKSDIGYEDWEYWVNLAEKGFWGKLIPEPLFMYRTSMQSRYVEDKDVHWTNMKSIRALHPRYKQKVQRMLTKRQSIKQIVEPSSAFVNLSHQTSYLQNSSKPNVLIAIPWMTFGGAETLILNFCREVKNSYNLSFVTGLLSEHEWEYKFEEISPYIYHLANLFDRKESYIEFMSNYIKTRNIDVLHIVHTDFVFEFLDELKERNPKLKVIVTMFNDRAVQFSKSLEKREYVDAFTSDNKSVYEHYRKELGESVDIRVIPNGINANDIFNPVLSNRSGERASLNIEGNNLAVFFIGRLAEEKNPDLFCEVAEEIIKQKSTGLQFFIIGDGPMRLEIEKRVRQINDDRLVYLGYQSEISRYLSAADIFILPSSIEGFPLSILEAMAMRVAVIASDVGAVAEVIDSGSDGYVVPPASVADITSEVLNLNIQRRKLEDVKAKARQKVEKKYSNVTLGHNYKKLYKDLLK